MVVAELPPCVPSYLEHAEMVTAIAGLLLNVVLALLIVYRTPKELRVYSRVLMTNCITDIVFTFTVMLFQVHVYFRNGVVYYSVRNTFSESLSEKYREVGVYIVVVLTTVHMVGLPFVYRYFAICRDSTISNRAFVIMTFIPLFISLPTASLQYHLWWPIVEDNAKRFDSLPADCFSRTEIRMYTFEQVLTPRIAGILFMHAIVITFLYVVIVACSVAIRRAIKQVSYCSSSNVSATQSQLSRVLYLQALSPLFLAVIPLLGTLLCLAFSLKALELFVHLSTTFLCFMPLMNPLMAICLIKAYRTALFRSVNQSFHRVAAVSPAPETIFS